MFTHMYIYIYVWYIWRCFQFFMFWLPVPSANSFAIFYHTNLKLMYSCTDWVTNGSVYKSGERNFKEILWFQFVVVNDTFYEDDDLIFHFRIGIEFKSLRLQKMKWMSLLEVHVCKNHSGLVLEWKLVWRRRSSYISNNFVKLHFYALYVNQINWVESEISYIIFIKLLYKITNLCGVEKISSKNVSLCSFMNGIFREGEKVWNSVYNFTERVQAVLYFAPGVKNILLRNCYNL